MRVEVGLKVLTYATYTLGAVTRPTRWAPLSL